jgi:GR25 family glycosyltransferase involved in LPS biosynthesis
LNNIYDQQQKISKEIDIFDAVKGDQLNIDDLIESGQIHSKYKDGGTTYKKREIGCYLSHYSIFKQIKEKRRTDYTIVLEDDFVVVTNDLMHETNEALDKILAEKIDFDVLFLGHINKSRDDDTSNYSDGNDDYRIIDNIYKVDPEYSLIGTHAYLINNKNIDKLIEATEFMHMPIDNKFKELSKNDTLNVLLIYPTLVNQSNEIPSDIRNMKIKT